MTDLVLASGRDNKSPPNNNNTEFSPPAGGPPQQYAVARTTHSQHGIYNALLSSASASNPYHQPSETQILEKSINLTAAAPPLKLAPPFPGHCAALNTSNLSTLQQIQRAQQQQLLFQQSQNQHNNNNGSFNNNNNVVPQHSNIKNFLSIGGISARGGADDGSATANSNSNNNNVNNNNNQNNNNNNNNPNSWRDADPSKTHAVVVALCLGRAAWDFASDDAPVDLVNNGAPPLLSVDIGGDDNNNNGDGNNNNNNDNEFGGGDKQKNKQNNTNNNHNQRNNNDVKNNMNIFATNFINNNQHNLQNQDGLQGGVAFYVERRGGVGGNNNNNNINNNNNFVGNQIRQQQQIMLMSQQLLIQNNNNMVLLNNNVVGGGNNQNNNNNAALIALQAISTTNPTNGNTNSTQQQPQQQQQSENKNEKDSQQQQQQQQQHQTSLQAAVAAANNNNQGTVHPPGAPSTLYSWRALRAHSDVASRSCARAGEGVEALYLEMMKQRPDTGLVKVITPLVNPTTENIRDVLHKGASDATDEMQKRNAANQRKGVTNAYTGTNKILLHYVGHGVPRPERGCMYFARSATQRQHHAFAPVRDILQHLGTPCMLLCDCASAGNIKSAVVQVERELNPYSNAKEHRFFWGSCSDGEPLPHHHLMPDDLFSSIMISPIRMAVLFFIVQRKNLYDFPPYLVHCFANEWAAKVTPGNPVAEVRNAFNAIVESIAAKVLSPDVFYVCFRQDTVVLNLFRAFILAQRIISSLGCEPCSHPHVPIDTAFHSLWQSFDFVVEGVLGSIMRQWRPKPSHGLSVHAFRMALDPTLVLKNMPDLPTVPVSTFFQDSLISLLGQFDSVQAQALVIGSVVSPPSSSQAHHGDLLAYPQHQDEVLTTMHKQFTALQQQRNPNSNQHHYAAYHSHPYGGGGGGGGGGDENDYFGGGNPNGGLDGGGIDADGGALIVDFASHLLTRGNNNFGGGGGFGHNNNFSSSNAAALSDQQVQDLLGSTTFPTRDLISFVGTRFPILQHSLVGKDTRFFGLLILARWLDLGSLAVECCELFGLYKELLCRLWNLPNPVEDQDPLLVLIAAKTCMTDSKILLIGKSLQVPMNFCARVFNAPQEPKDPAKLGILGQANTQRWFSAATIALCLLRQPDLVLLAPTNANPALIVNSPSAPSLQQQQQQIPNPNFNPYMNNVGSIIIASSSTSTKTTANYHLSCAVANTCVEVLDRQIPPKPRNAPDSDSEPSIANNLKSSCLAVLGCIAFALRDCFSTACPFIPSILPFQPTVSLPSTASPSPHLLHQFQQQQQYFLHQQQLILQLVHQQFIYQNTPQQNQIKFISQFLLPAMKENWIESVAALLSHKDSTPRLRWGAARTLHIFLIVLSKINAEASTNRKHILHLVLPTALVQQLYGNNGTEQQATTSSTLATAANSTIGSVAEDLAYLHHSSSPSGSPSFHHDHHLHHQNSNTTTAAMTREQQLQAEENDVISSLDPQLQYHLKFLADIEQVASALQVKAVSKLVNHCTKTEGNVDVRREILGAVTAFCLSQDDFMFSNVIQSEMRALFTGVASPNRFGIVSSNPFGSPVGSPSFLQNNNNQQKQQSDGSNGKSGGGAVTPNSQQLLQNHQARLNGRTTSDFDPTNSLHHNNTNNSNNQQQQPTTGNFSHYLVSCQTTPQVSNIGTPMKQHHQENNVQNNNNNQHFLHNNRVDSNFLSRGTSKLDANNNNVMNNNNNSNLSSNNLLVSPNANNQQQQGGGGVRSVPFLQGGNQPVQQNLFGTNNNNNNNVQTTPSNNNNNNSMNQTVNLSAETANTPEDQHHNNTSIASTTIINNITTFLPQVDGKDDAPLLFLQNYSKGTGGFANQGINNNNNNDVVVPMIVDRRMIVLLVAVRWILSLKQDAHPILRVLSIRALQKFVAEKFITLGLFTKVPVGSNINNNTSLNTTGNFSQQGYFGGGRNNNHINNNNLSRRNNNNNIGGGAGGKPSYFGDDYHNDNNNNDDDDDEDEYDDSILPANRRQSTNTNTNNNNNNNNSFGGNRNPSFVSTNNNNNNKNNQPQPQQNNTKKSMFGRFADLFSGKNQGKSTSTNNNSHMDPNNANNVNYGDDTTFQDSDLDKFLFSETDASILFDFEAPALSLLDLETSDIAMVEFVNEMLRTLVKPVIPRICQRVSLGDLPARFSRPATTAAAINQACSAPLVGDVAPHRCVFHSYVKRTLTQANAARHETALSDIVQRHVYPQVDAAHVVFHPNEQFAVCCSHDEVLTVVSTAPRDKRVFNSVKMEKILPNGVEEIDVYPGGGGAGGGGDESSDGGSYRTPRFGSVANNTNGAGGVNALRGIPKKTSALILLDAVYSHTVAVVASDSSVRIVTDVANRTGIRIATAFPGMSSSFDSTAASLPHHGGGVANATSANNNTHSNNIPSPSPSSSSYSGITNSLAAYQPLGQRMLVTGESHRFALWDIGQQRKLDERYALPPSVSSYITCVCPFAASPECFVLGLNRSVIVTDHRMKDTTAGTLHIPQAFAGSGCVTVMSHPGAQHKITGVAYTGLTCIWDIRYSLEVGDNRSVLPGYGGQLHPGMTRSAFPRAGYLAGTAPVKRDSNTAGGGGVPQMEDPASLGKVTTAAIHPLFSEAPLVAGCVNSKFKVMLPDQVLAQRNELPIVCAWHPFEVVGAVVSWTSEIQNRKLEIFAAASKDHRTDAIVDLIL